MPQHIYLADDSVAANIAFGLNAGKIDQQAVERAAKIANLHEFVSNELPQGYATTVGERGVRLSGGQRQRVAIARAVLKDAPMLILDEATSAVDNETEAALQRSIQRISEGRTTIVIAHRLSTIRHADRIVVLENGAVIEDGQHESLVESAGVYAKLWSVQTGERFEPLKSGRES